jgi:hypothetical protein
MSPAHVNGSRAPDPNRPSTTCSVNEVLAPFPNTEDATAQAVDLLKSNCPTFQALTPVVRLEAMEQRLAAMFQAVQTVEPVFEKFYGSLSDEQKERFNRLPPREA